jgi:hypothetical protein
MSSSCGSQKITSFVSVMDEKVMNMKIERFSKNVRLINTYRDTENFSPVHNWLRYRVKSPVDFLAAHRAGIKINVICNGYHPFHMIFLKPDSDKIVNRFNDYDYFLVFIMTGGIDMKMTDPSGKTLREYIIESDNDDLIQIMETYFPQG